MKLYSMVTVLCLLSNDGSTTDLRSALIAVCQTSLNSNTDSSVWFLPPDNEKISWVLQNCLSATKEIQFVFPSDEFNPVTDEILNLVRFGTVMDVQQRASSSGTCNCSASLCFRKTYDEKHVHIPLLRSTPYEHSLALIVASTLCYLQQKRKQDTCRTLPDVILVYAQSFKVTVDNAKVLLNCLLPECLPSLTVGELMVGHANLSVGKRRLSATELFDLRRGAISQTVIERMSLEFVCSSEQQQLETCSKLTHCALVFELLGRSRSLTVNDVAKAEDATNPKKQMPHLAKRGVFVMYNYCRLCSILRKFELLSSGDNARYPKLPPVNLLPSEALEAAELEAGQVLTAVKALEQLLKRCEDEAITQESKLCQLLIELSTATSIFYSCPFHMANEEDDSKHVFVQYKTVGLVCNKVPIAVVYRQKRRMNVIIAVIGRAFKTYNASNLRILSTSDSLSCDIEAIAADGRFVYASAGNVIYAFHLSRQVEHVYEGHTSTVKLLLPFASKLISVDATSCLKVWDIESREVLFEQCFDADVFFVSCLCHPLTYINKILLGSEQGQLKLINAASGRLVYEFAGWKSAVIVLEQSPVVDIVAVGLDNGKIVMHNLKLDKTLFEVKQLWSPVTSVSFRTDGVPLMFSSSASGHIAIWNLDKQRLCGQINAAHSGGVTAVVALDQEPVIVTSGSDNALRTWIFDGSEIGISRLLCVLEGHSSPPSLVRFISGSKSIADDDSVILSCNKAHSKLLLFSVLKDSKHNNFGTVAKISKKLAKRLDENLNEHEYGEITFIAVETARETAWDNVVCCHKNSSVVTTWSSEKTKVGKHRLCNGRFGSNPELREAQAVCCDISCCGNFVAVAYDTGHIDLFNLQSGKFRGTYKDKTLTLPKAHAASVLGLASDGLNLELISGDSTGLLKFWAFKRKVLKASLALDAAVKKVVLNRGNNLAAVALSNLSLIVVDVSCRRVVRQFGNAHSAAFTDLAFSFNGHWIITAANDKSIRIWDLPSSRLVDSAQFDESCTSLALSPNGQYLATTFEGLLGIRLWANKLMLQSDFVLDHIPHGSDIPQPAADAQPTEEETSVSIDGRSESSLTELSSKPSWYWPNLLHIEQIKERNKPTQPLKLPSVPFFLPTTGGSEIKFDITDALTHQDTRIVNLKKLEPMSPFAVKLKGASDLTEPFQLLRQYGHAGLDYEIRGLSPLSGGSLSLMAKFLEMIVLCLKLGTEFDLVMASLGLFLKLHRELLWNNKENFEVVLQEISNSLDVRWNKLDSSANECICIVKYLKNAVV